MANTLVTFGFCWMVVGAVIGLLLAPRHERTLVELERIAASGSLADYHRVNDGYKWNKMVHAHSFLFAVVATTIGLALAKMNYSAAVSDGLALALMLSPVVWTLGGLLKNRPLMAIGDIVLLVSVATAAVGMAKVL